MHKTENPGGWGWGEVAQNPWGRGVNAFGAKSQGGTPILGFIAFFKNLPGGVICHPINPLPLTPLNPPVCICDCSNDFQDMILNHVGKQTNFYITL
jgi:hypothetical protein